MVWFFKIHGYLKELLKKIFRDKNLGIIIYLILNINTFKVFESVRNNATCIFFWTQWLVKFIEIIHSFEIYLFKISENYETFVTKLHKFNIEKFFEQGVNNCIPKRKSK